MLCFVIIFKFNLLSYLCVYFIKAVCVPGVPPGMSQELMYRITLAPVHVAKEPIPPRHRRKRRDDEVVSTGAQATQTTTNSRGAQFDLEDSAFPPLPGKKILLVFMI